MRSLQFLIFAFTTSLPISAVADLYLTPYTGYLFGGQVEDNQGQSYDLSPSGSLALTLEIPFETGRVGLFYARQSTHVDELGDKVTLHYFLFQSRIDYSVIPNWQVYLGAGLGASYFDVNWAEQKSGFAASIFSGVDYPLTSYMDLTTQIRWLGTVVDNDTSAICNLTETEHCIVRFKSDWMNQFTANIGITIRF